MKAIVEHMSGDRVDGYYYIILEGTNFILCEDGHPDFPHTFEENEEEKAQSSANEINKRINL